MSTKYRARYFYYYSLTTAQVKQPAVTELLLTALLNRDAKIMKRDLPYARSARDHPSIFIQISMSCDRGCRSDHHEVRYRAAVISSITDRTR